MWHIYSDKCLPECKLCSLHINLSVLGIELEEICLSLVEHPVRCDYFYVKMRSLSCGITICCASTVCCGVWVSCVMLLFSFSLFIIPVFCLFLLDIFFLLQSLSCYPNVIWLFFHVLFYNTMMLLCLLIIAYADKHFQYPAVSPHLEWMHSFFSGQTQDTLNE